MKRALAILTALVIAACSGSQRPPSTAPSAPTDTPPVRRDQLPKPGPAPTWAPPAVQTWTLANGIRVYFLRQGEAPLVALHLIIPRGGATDPDGKAGLTALTADLLDEGAAGRSALEISETLQRLATDYDADVGTDAVTLRMDLLVDQLEPSAKLLADLARRPGFPPEEFERRKAQRIAAALASEADPGTARSVALRRVLFGQGYGGYPPGGVRRTIEALTLEDVKAQYARAFTPDGASLVVVGGLDAAAARPVLEAAFGDWTGRSTVTVRAISERRPRRAAYLVDYPGATQSALAVGRRATGARAKDYFDAMVYNWVLGGAFTSRLNLNLREDKGYTYDARSVFNRWRDAGFFALVANVKSETTAASVKEMFAELGGPCGARPLTDQERAEATGGLLLGFPGRFERVGGIAAQLDGLPLYGRGPDWYARWPARVHAVTSQAAQTVAQRSCNPGDFVVVIAGDKGKVGPALAALHLEVLELDPQGSRIKD